MKNQKILQAMLDADKQRRVVISRRLHNQVGQGLTTVGVQLDLLRLDFGQVDGLVARISEVQGELQKTFSQVRLIMQTMTPEWLNRDGLIAALRNLDGVKLEVRDKPDLRPEETAGFYLAAEAVAADARRKAPDVEIAMTIDRYQLRIAGCELSPLVELIAKQGGVTITVTGDIIEVAI